MDLVCLDPNHLINTGITPDSHTLASNLHGTSSNPKKQKSFILQKRHWHLSHFIIVHGPIRKLESAKEISEMTNG